MVEHKKLMKSKRSMEEDQEEYLSGLTIRLGAVVKVAGKESNKKQYY